MNALLIGMLALGALAIPQAGHAQTPQPARQTGTGVISGMVVGEDGAPISAATVAIKRAANGPVVGGRISDREGRFSVTGLSAGTYQLEVRAVGRAPLDRADLVVSEGGRVELGSVRLAAAAVQVQGVTAQGTRSPVVVAADRSIYSVREMPISQGAMATEALRTIPEVDVDFEDVIRARGGTPQIYVDGRPATMQGEALTNFIRSLRADRLDRIEYIANPSASFDSEGQSGIINLVMRRDVNLGLSGTLSGNAGTKGTSGSALRLNYQEGRLTVFGGGTANLRDATTITNDLRQNLATQPNTFLEQSSVTDLDSRSGNADVQAEWRLTPRTTVWGSGRANWGETRRDGLNGFAWMDALQTPTERSEQLMDSHLSNRSWGGSLGLRRVITPMRDEFSTELRYGVNWQHASSDFDRVLLGLGTGQPMGLPQVINNDGYHDDDVLSFQADLSKPIGANGKFDIGYRANLRDNQDEQRLFDYPTPGATPARTEHDLFKHLEDFHAAYLTLERRFGKLTAQAGLRAERADTRVNIPTAGLDVENDANQLYPSANVAYDFGAGKTTRLSYSKRVQRPGSQQLNPINLNPGDPFNRSFGNPALDPMYVHSVSFDAAWSGQLGTLRASPYFFFLDDLWDRVRVVDANGVSNLRTQNAGDVKYGGASFSASLRQWGPLSGQVGLNLLHGSLEGSGPNVNSFTATAYQVNGNVTMRFSPTLNVQANVNYSPWSPMAQGKQVQTVYSTVAIRQQLFSNKISAALSVLDPFDVYRMRFETSDNAHQANGRTNPSQRRATLTLSYNFGRTPQSNRRTVQDAQAEVPGGGGEVR